MTSKRRWILVAGAVIVAGAAGGAVALAGGGEDERATGPQADAAARAAVKIAGGGKAAGVERDVEGTRVWEVEVARPDGTTLEVDLDAALAPLADEPDDDDSGGDRGDGDGDRGEAHDDDD